MQSKNLLSKIKRGGLALSLLIGIAAASAVTAQAQYPQYQDNRYWQNQNYDRGDWQRNNRRGRQGRNNRDDYPNWGGSFQLRQTALNAGFNNGIERGRKDRRDNKRYDFRNESEFQKATEDYSSKLGNRELYRRYFREAYARGYESGYQGY